jgi:hypothetical protein
MSGDTCAEGNEADGAAFPTFVGACDEAICADAELSATARIAVMWR